MKFLKQFEQWIIDVFIIGYCGEGEDDPEPSPDPDPEPSPNEPFYKALPEDWRDQLAGEDKARLNDLSRYPSLDAWIASGFEAKDRIRKGEVSTGLPENATDEQVAAYREANGIPATPDDYNITLSDQAQLTDMEKEIMGGVAAVAHQANIPNAALSALTDAWLQGKQAQLQRMDDQDGLHKQEAERTLRDHWGADFKRNMGAAVSMLNGIPEEDRALVMNARDENGRFLMSSPYFVQFLANSALQINPMATLPGGGDDPDGTASSVISEVQKIFAEGRENVDYWKNPELQARYEKALDQQLKRKEQQGAR